MVDMLEVTLADGRELDIPRGSVVMFEGMLEGANPNFPKAKTFIRYGMGQELRTGILSTKIEDLSFELNVAASPQWLRLTKSTGEPLIILASNVVGRLALEDGCELSLMVGTSVEVFAVKESRRQIKKWSERGEGRPEGLVEIPTAQEVE